MEVALPIGVRPTGADLGIAGRTVTCSAVANPLRQARIMAFEKEKALPHLLVGCDGWRFPNRSVKCSRDEAACITPGIEDARELIGRAMSNGVGNGRQRFDFASTV